MTRNFFIGIVASILLFGTAHGQMIEQKVEVIFNLNEHAVQSTSDANREEILSLEEIINRSKTDSLFRITAVCVDSYASPEGGDRYNKALATRRAESIRRYLCDEWNIADSLITTSSHGVAWEKLRQMVADSEMESRDEVLRIIDNVPTETWRRVKPTDRWQTMVDSRNKQLMDLEKGVPYIYMAQNFFPTLRRGDIVTISFISPKPSIATEDDKPLFADKVSTSTIKTTAQPHSALDENTSDNNGITFALKTNLLYDAVTAVNVELEVPINERWSVAGEWIFPWWTIDNGSKSSIRNRLQMLQGNAMAKYWFGNRELQPQLTGWFAGVYAGAGLYDFEYHKKGVQGEFFIAGGVAAGYAHTINKRGNLRMEYSVGVGYLKTDYRRYTSEYYDEDDWRAIRTSSGNYSWFGPTQAKVSLVWLINSKAKKGGKR